MSDNTEGGATAAANLDNLEKQFGRDTTKELVKAYFDDTQEVLEKMQEAIINRDTKALKPLAHMLKSAAKIVGAMDLSKLSAELETMCTPEQNEWLKVETFFENFSASFKATNEYLRQYVG